MGPGASDKVPWRLSLCCRCESARGVEKANLACFNSGHRMEDHFVDVTEMIEIGKGGQRAVRTIFLSRYACDLTIQNADPEKQSVSTGLQVRTAYGKNEGSVPRISRIAAAS